MTLHDGRRVDVRPILPGDGPGLAAAIRASDHDTLRRRFLGGRPRVTRELIEHLTTVDYVSRFALVAIDPASQRGVAIARYEPAGDDGAEIAVAVSPAWRHAGLATALIRLLGEAAAERGIRTIKGSYLADNRPVAALVADLGEFADQIIENGIAEFSVALAARPDAGHGPDRPGAAGRVPRG